MYDEASLLPLSGLQHLAFCERQWALIHIEQAWAENRLTAEGQLLHENVDEPHYETREGVRLVRALALRSLRLGISGRADLVEFPREQQAAPTPVEFKRGKPKSGDFDEVQLCAQALCLEEMLETRIERGLIYYHQIRHRHEIAFSEELRRRVEELSMRMHELFEKQLTPRARRESKCRQCSLVELCQPDWLDSRSDPWKRWNELAAGRER